MTGKISGGGGGEVSDYWLDVRKRAGGGGGDLDAYSVQRGGGGSLKNRKKCLCN